MNIELVRYPSRPKNVSASRCVLTLGSFDGLHLGHQSLIASLPTSYPRVVISFYPHPIKVIRGIAVPRLASLRSQLRILSSLGVSTLYLVRFSKELAQWSAQRFVNEIILPLNPQHIVVGADAHIGVGREGDVRWMTHEFASRGIDLSVAPYLTVSEGRISSRRARESLAAGDLALVSALLGRPFSLSGIARHGAGRGRTIGFPTANLRPRPQELLPPRGVYITTASYQGKSYPSITNIGYAPTFNLNNSTSVETHVLHPVQEDLYNKHLEIAFYERIRDEIQFNSPTELVAQIAKDCARAKAFHGIS
jgi:riboflavin kinase/FMN adenylyltransferase